MILRTRSFAVLIAMSAASVAYSNNVDSFNTGGDAASGEYNDGVTLVGQDPTVAGWVDPWEDQGGGPSNGSEVSATGLSLGALPVSGGSVEIPGFSGARTGRELATPRFGVDETLYLSFLMDATGVFQGEVDAEDFGNVVPAFTFAAFELHEFAPNDANRQLQISVGDNFVTDDGFGNPGPSFGDFKGDFQLSESQNDNQLAVNLGPNDGGVNHFVLKLELSSAASSDTVTVYRNPESLVDESAATIDAQLSGLDLEFAYTSFARFDPFFGSAVPTPPSSASVFFDELRLSGSFQGATGVPEPTSAVLLATCMTALSFARRR